MISALRVRGTFRGASGYDHHVREFVRELARQGVDLQLVDVPEWTPIRLPEGLRDHWFDTLSAPVNARITLHFTTPEWVRPDGSTRDVNYTMFEADRVIPDWIAHNRMHALVIVPTESSRRAWVDSGLPEERIEVCPLGINPELFGGGVKPLDLCTQAGRRVSEVRTRFLNVSELGPRKNLIGLLHAWLLATNVSDDALLILKLAQPSQGWLDLLLAQMRQLEQRVDRRFSQAAPIEFLFDLLADREMPRLYAAATHYISLSHGEGWDQPMVEAAASGLRLIAPDHSAYRAYLSPRTATLIPSPVVPARFQGPASLRRLFAGTNWWQPDVEAAAEAIRAALDGRGRAPYGAREHVLSHFTWQQSTRRLIEILSRVEDDLTVRAGR